MAPVKSNIIKLHPDVTIYPMYIIINLIIYNNVLDRMIVFYLDVL